MTRTETLASYTVENGRIVSPGKYEGVHIYAPHFVSILNEGLASSNGHIPIMPEDRAEYPEIPRNRRILRVWEDDQGFAYVR